MKTHGQRTKLSVTSGNILFILTPIKTLPSVSLCSLLVPQNEGQAKLEREKGRPGQKKWRSREKAPGVGQKEATCTESRVPPCLAGRDVLAERGRVPSMNVEHGAVRRTGLVAPVAAGFTSSEWTN